MRLGFLVLLGLLGAAPAFADEAVRTGAAAFGDWRTDAPGVRRLITPADLPRHMRRTRQRTCRNTKRGPTPKFQRRRRASRSSHSPPGSTCRASFASRRTATSSSPKPEPEACASSDPAARLRTGARRDLRRPACSGRTGLLSILRGANPRFVYVASPDSIVRFPYRSGDMKASGPAEKIASLPRGGGHWTRDLAFSARRQDAVRVRRLRQQCRRGRASRGPRPASPKRRSAPRSATRRRRADVLAFDPDGKNERVYATGIRNCSGLAVQPGTGALWCAVNERDGLGDDLPPDYATHVAPGAFYGWPWYYLGDHQDPRHKGERADLANAVTTPDVLIQAHSAPLGIAFYAADQFPSDYKGRRLRHAARLVEPGQAHRLQGRAPPYEGRQADRRV